MVADENSQTASGPDDTVPSAERQVELQAAYEANVVAGKPPYDAVAIRTRGELQWVMEAQDWSGENVGLMPDRKKVNLSGAMLEEANLSGATLEEANLSNARLGTANLSNAMLGKANLSGATLEEANLSNARLGTANLSNAMLARANLSNTMLIGADLSSANLVEANLSGATLRWADLSGADLRECRFDAATNLSDARLDMATRLADVFWSDTPLTRVTWEAVPTLGDEAEARRTRLADVSRRDTPLDIPLPPVTSEVVPTPGGELQAWYIANGRKGRARRLDDYEAAARAYRQLAVALRGQGMNDAADRYAYRAQLMQRVVFRCRWHYFQYVGSLFLDLLAGYGFRPGRAILLYLGVILWFANFYVWASHGLFSLGLPPTHVQPLQWYEGLILSVSSFHGRGFQPFQNLNDPIAALAGMQAVFGLIIEVSFIATFTQRFFAR